VGAHKSETGELGAQSMVTRGPQVGVTHAVTGFPSLVGLQWLGVESAGCPVHHDRGFTN
jgi:hypothetical protein